MHKNLYISPSQKEWLKTKPDLHLNVDLDKIPVKEVQVKPQAFSFDEPKFDNNSKNKYF